MNQLYLVYIHVFQKHIKLALFVYFVFPYICHFLLYCPIMMLVNIKFDFRGYKRITFQVYSLHWSCSFLMAQLKQIWQCSYSCTVVSLWENSNVSDLYGFQLVSFCLLWVIYVSCVYPTDTDTHIKTIFGYWMTHRYILCNGHPFQFPSPYRVIIHCM